VVRPFPRQPTPIHVPDHQAATRKLSPVVTATALASGLAVALPLEFL
jgi:hypothetical protein